MALCKALTKRGTACKARAMANGFCYRHNPDIDSLDKLLASRKGGSNNRNGLLTAHSQLDTLDELERLLTDNIQALTRGDISVREANAVAQSVSVLIKTKTLAELDQRLERIESRLNQSEGIRI